MAKDINLTSQKWNDIVFEYKPKDYGAYELRQSSSRRHIWAFIIGVLLVVLVSLLPLIMETVAGLRRTAPPVEEDTTLADLQALDEQKMEQAVKDVAPPPPPLKSTIQFVAPEIVPEEEIQDDQLKSQDDLQDVDTQISLMDVEGTDDDFGVDAADLATHQEASEEVVEDKILDFVQQMPTFPGGEAELRKWLKANLEYPMIAAENGVQGTVMTRFTVNTDGTITNITVLSSPDSSLSEEAIRVLNKMSAWVPGRQNGEVVRVNFSMPVQFVLQ